MEKGGWEEGRGSPSKVVICPLLETGFFFWKGPCSRSRAGGRCGGGGGRRRGWGGFNPLCYYVIWCGASSISMRKVSMGVSPMSLKKNKCSRHFRPMERSAGNRSNSLANLSQHKTEIKRQHSHLTGRGRDEEMRLEQNNLSLDSITDSTLRGRASV